MNTPYTAFVFAPKIDDVLKTVRQWVSDKGLSEVCVQEADSLLDAALLDAALRSRHRIAIFDARKGDIREIAEHPALHACQRLKADSFTGVVPAVVLVSTARAVPAAFASGADEVLTPKFSVAVIRARLESMLRRSDRDVHVHPSSGLPGAAEIEMEIGARLDRNEVFAVGYADLDHFKEYNDRYSYHDGNRVIRMLSKILHDEVKGSCGERGFIGHIGGDDFIFIMPLERLHETCQGIVRQFDALVPFEYSEADRSAGQFEGKDRRGQAYQVPLLTVSVGVVTNERRHFLHPSQVSELATEMKSYAKTIPGSVFAVDRRGEGPFDEGAVSRGVKSDGGGQS